MDAEGQRTVLGRWTQDWRGRAEGGREAALEKQDAEYKWDSNINCVKVT